MSNEYYRIETTNLETEKSRSLNYDTRREAMDHWDKVVDRAIPGERVRLIDVDAGRILSEYTPAHF